MHSSSSLRLVSSALVATVLGCSGTGEIRKSQHATLAQMVGRTEISVEYSRPVARGRALFGALVPYDTPWNPGADQATAITFSTAVRIEGQPVGAGTYSIWVVPDTAQWTFILSRAGDVFHTPYPEGQDALRLRIAPRRGSHMETLAFYFPVVDGMHAELVMHWGDTVLPISIDAPP